MKAIDKFHELETGVLGIVRASDIYARLTMCKIRNENPDIKSIMSLMSSKKISGLNLVGSAYTKEELDLLKNENFFTPIGQQIIVASHTALETYLILKFKEYYRYIFSTSDKLLIEESLKLINSKLRGLDDFKEAYKKYLKIHIPSFEIDYYSSQDCNFEPKNTWNAMMLLYQTRNNIVHKGTSVDYEITSLMDSWYPFEFITRWVSLFDTNFDYFVYEKRETKLYIEYKNRAIKSKVLK